jgi:hypothetical protein
LILQLDLFVLVLYEKHIHKQKGVPHRLGPSMVVEAHPPLAAFSSASLYARHSGLRYVPSWIIASVQPVVILHLAPIPDAIVSAMEAHGGMICSLLCAHRKPKAIDQDFGDIPFPPDMQDSA